MAKVKKYAKGGSYYVTVPDPTKAAPKEKPAPKFNTGGWNIPAMQPTK
jgi:hypothetical protein